MPLELTAPLFCSGVATYGALKHYGFIGGEKRTVGVVGIGGMGTIGIKIAVALGHQVVAISTNPAKEELAKKKGATHFVLSSNPESVAAQAGKCDIILNLLSIPHDLKTYIPLLAKSGILCQMGAVGAPHQFSQIPLMFNRFKIGGNLVGGLADHQECVNFCA
jgi:uncharacterized zinc-type alcohol dehydrogenase-like protein